MRWGFALVVLAGCSAVYGLDGVKTDDRDGDGIPDTIDNCPDIANHDQSDVDMNGVGDACQLCMATDPTDSDGDGIPDQCDGCDNRQPDNNHDGIPDACENAAPLHDEDGDGVPDIHDNCPAVKNGDQLDSNDGGAIADGVGDACDDSIAFDRQMFDGFADSSLLWVTSGSGWSIENDQAVIAETAQGAYRYAGFAHGAFRISTRVSLPANGDVSIVALDGAPPTTQFKIVCAISSKNGARNLTVTTSSGGGLLQTISVAYPGTGSAGELFLDGVTGGTQVALTCGTPVGSTPTVAANTTAPTWTPGIGAAVTGPGSSNGETVAFDYFDIVTSGL